jgi:uncharacterized ubiquitin-like protein YukD
MGGTVIVTVIIGNNSYDLELPARVPVSELSRRLKIVITQKGVYGFTSDTPQINSEWLKRALFLNETLEMAGITDGDTLRLVEVGNGY